MKLFKTSKVLVEAGKENEAYELLEKNGFITFNNSRFRFDFNTAIVMCIAGLVAWILITQI